MINSFVIVDIMKKLTQEQVYKEVFDDAYKKFVEEPTHFNASMKFSTWGDYVEEFKPGYKPEYLQAIRKAEDKYHALCDAGKHAMCYKVCSNCKQTYSGYMTALDDCPTCISPEEFKESMDKAEEANNCLGFTEAEDKKDLSINVEHIIRDCGGIREIADAINKAGE